VTVHWSSFWKYVAGGVLLGKRGKVTEFKVGQEMGYSRGKVVESVRSWSGTGIWSNRSCWLCQFIHNISQL